MPQRGEKTIGVVGGLGARAGLDLVEKILERSGTMRDQEQLEIVLVSAATHIPDRSDFLAGRITTNPALGIAEVLRKLESAGAEVACIACHTAHCAPIYDVIINELERRNSKLELVHMIQTTAKFLGVNSSFTKVGVLCTEGTLLSDLYSDWLTPRGIAVVYPDARVQRDCVNRAIYDERIGIKYARGRVSQQCRELLIRAVDNLRTRGAQAFLLGCTELPLAIRQSPSSSMPMIDPTWLLAETIVRKAAPKRLL